jgi:hypothetical protein
MILALLALATVSLAQAQVTHSTFSRTELETAISELYTLFPRQRPLIAHDLEQLPHWLFDLQGNEDVCSGCTTPEEAASPLGMGQAVQDADYLAAQIADLNTALYNDLITHAFINYRNHPEHRAALRILLESISARAQGRIRRVRDLQTAPYLRMIDHVVIACEWAYTFAFGYGVWSGGREIILASRMGHVMSRTQRFETLLRNIMHHTRLRQPFMAAAGGVGLAAGAIDLAFVLNAFQEVPLDPHELLIQTHSELARDLAESTQRFRSEACALPRERTLSRTQARELATIAFALMSERAELESFAPHTLHALRGTDDIRRAALQCLSRLEVELDSTRSLP